MTGPALLADLGATHVRFALADAGVPRDIAVMRTVEHASFEAAAAAYLAAYPPGARPRVAAIAVPAPTGAAEIRLTNLGWRFAPATVARALGLESCRVCNDFEAVARALPRLRPEDAVDVGPARIAADGVRAVLGPGTGLGMATLVHSGSRWLPLAGEGGHATLAPANAEEAAICAWLRDRYGHASAERALSGPGLVNLYLAHAALAGKPSVPAPAPADVTAAAVAGDALAARALATFFALLGSVAGDLALVSGARGGIWLAGGILPRLVERLQGSAFRERFIAKGRFREWLDAIPTRLIVHSQPGLLGLAAWLADERG